jgi:hydrogenase expression/formation protein HypE
MLTRELVNEVIAGRLDNPVLRPMDDSAVLKVGTVKLAFTTDSYVVTPYLFPGGDIGRLAVSGTVNDLSVQGAEPVCLSLALILEEGLPVADLKRIVESVQATARETGVDVVTGDTKVVERGKCEGIYINTAGIGRVVTRRPVSGHSAKAGDAVIVSGTLAEHGVAVLSRREGIAFSTSVVSDVAPLWSLVKSVLDTGADVHAMRDPTRGGLAVAVCDIAEASGVAVRLDEEPLPISREVQGACDLLGLDPLTIASEGRVVVFCAGKDAEKVVGAMRQHPLGREARVIGRCEAEPAGMTLLKTIIGGERIVDRPTGEDVPRIC